MAQLNGKMETLEKDLRDTRNKFNLSTSKCNDLEARCKEQDGEIKDLRHQVQDLTNELQVRDKEKAHMQRAPTCEVKVIKSHLGKANTEKMR